MNKQTLAALLLVGGSVFTPAHAVEPGTGNYWLPICESTKDWEKSVCLSYVLGLVDGINAQQAVSGSSRIFCTPEAVTRAQMRDVWIKAMRDHPAQRHERADHLFVASMMASYPCPKSNK